MVLHQVADSLMRGLALRVLVAGLTPYYRPNRPQSEFK